MDTGFLLEVIKRSKILYSDISTILQIHQKPLNYMYILNKWT